MERKSGRLWIRRTRKGRCLRDRGVGQTQKHRKHQSSVLHSGLSISRISVSISRASRATKKAGTDIRARDPSLAKKGYIAPRCPWPLRKLRQGVHTNRRGFMECSLLFLMGAASGYVRTVGHMCYRHTAFSPAPSAVAGPGCSLEPSDSSTADRTQTRQTSESSPCICSP